MKKFLFIVVLYVCVLPLSGQSPEGLWNGVLDIGQQKLWLEFDIAVQGSIYVGTMDSPDQGARGIPLSAVRFNFPDLYFEIGQLGVVYRGKLETDTLIVGTFTQLGTSYPLSLSKGRAAINRPQNPVAPYPYASENVSFPGKSPGVTLAGTLTTPRHGKEKYPAVVLVSGSGQQNRDEELFDHKPFLVIADYLTRRGIAVLRYDDRGVGESVGDYQSATTEDFCGDALAAFEFLLSRDETDHDKIGIIGHSEGRYDSVHGCGAEPLRIVYCLHGRDGGQR